MALLIASSLIVAFIAGLSVSVLTVVFKHYYDIIFIGGGTLLVIFGLMQLSGKKIFSAISCLSGTKTK